MTAGESHGPALTAILEGMPAGVPLAVEAINHELARRQVGYGSGGRMKIEKDTVRLTSGVAVGVTTGGPIALHVENDDWANWEGRQVTPITRPRPGHADLTGGLKYGYNDLRHALERASARETTMRVAMGALCKALLEALDVTVGGYVIVLGPVEATIPARPLAELVTLAEANEMRCPDPEAAEAMREAVKAIRKAQDTLGGILEVVAEGVPPGLGSYVQWDRRLEARLALAMMSIQAMKGVEIGPAFRNATLPGTEVHDEIFMEGGRPVRHSNRAGGFEGGITTGEPVVVRAAMKPISTILAGLRSVDLATQREEKTVYERSDFTAVHRAVVVAEAMVAFVLADAMLEKLGGDSLGEILPRLALLHEQQAAWLQGGVSSEPYEWRVP
ncbi:MAG: chorismate synthase [Ardenticatenales bacterium]|nr:chorismate synthase [Ardenticatenales bacterium]